MMIPGGARLMIGFEGREFRPELAELIEETAATGIILFARNIASAGSARTLIAAIRVAVPRPLVFAVDQEEGAVVRLAHGLDVLPGNTALGRVGAEDLARRAARVSAATMAAIGFDLVLAPVVDLRGAVDNPITGLRSFGNDPELVGRLARAYAEGLEEGGCASCAKHFPGLGPARVDPHFSLPVIDSAIDPADDLAPFAAVVGSASSVMSTHVVVRALDAERPATFSAATLRGLLRATIGFGGALLTDDLVMGGAAHEGGLEGAVVGAAQAGHDVLLVCHEAVNARRAARALDAALQDGRLDPTEHAAAVERFLGLARRRPGERPMPVEDRARLALEIAARGIELCGDPRRLPIASSARVRILDLVASPIDPAEDGFERPAPALAALLRAEGLNDVRVLADDEEPSAAGFDRLVVVIGNLERRVGGRERALSFEREHHDRTIFVLVGPASDREGLENAAVVLDLGGARRAQIVAATSILSQSSR